MSVQFVKAEWNEKPPAVEPLKGGLVRVNRNLVEETREAEDGSTHSMWVGETLVMKEEAYFAYAGANEAEARRERVVAEEAIDEYTLALINEGVI